MFDALPTASGTALLFPLALLHNAECCDGVFLLS